MNGGYRAAMRAAQKLPRPLPARSFSKKYAVFLVGALLFCIILGAAYVYTSTGTGPAWYLNPVEKPVEPAPIPVAPPPSKAVTVPPKEVAKPAFQPHAVINVPSVGLRNSPDIDAKVTSTRLTQGEGVQIVKRHSERGPEWVQVKTKSGKVGWVFASVLTERKRK